MQALCADRDAKQEEVTLLRGTTAKQMWNLDLETFLVAYTENEEAMAATNVKLAKQQVRAETLVSTRRTADWFHMFQMFGYILMRSPWNVPIIRMAAYLSWSRSCLYRRQRIEPTPREASPRRRRRRLRAATPKHPTSSPTTNSYQRVRWLVLLLRSTYDVKLSARSFQTAS